MTLDLSNLVPEPNSIGELEPITPDSSLTQCVTRIDQLEDRCSGIKDRLQKHLDGVRKIRPQDTAVDGHLLRAYEALEVLLVRINEDVTAGYRTENGSVHHPC